MISQQGLESFDWLQWLGTGELAARQLCCNQATVSRHAQHVQETFGIRLQRLRSGAYGISGNALLLRLERQVHQMARMLGKRPMRLHLITDKGYLPNGLPHGWCCNPPSRQEYVVNGAELLDNYVVEACIMQRPQVLALDSKRFCLIELFRSPLYLVTNPAHVLSDEKGLTATDLVAHTRLSHLNVLPLATRLATEQLHASLLGDQAPVDDQAVDANHLAACTEISQVFYVNALGLGRQDRVCIDFEVNYTTSDFLVILRENMESSGIQLLLDALRLSLRSTATHLPQLSCAL
jgi:DNA-binding transcriptional LysR family regulator